MKSRRQANERKFKRDRAKWRLAKGRIDKDPDYLEWLHTQPCAISGSRERIEAAHVGIRGLRQKCPDREAIPLQWKYHARESKIGHHHLGRQFWDTYSLDRAAVIALHQERYRAAGGILL